MKIKNLIEKMNFKNLFVFIGIMLIIGSFTIAHEVGKITKPLTVKHKSPKPLWEVTLENKEIENETIPCVTYKPTKNNKENLLPRLSLWINNYRGTVTVEDKKISSNHMGTYELSEETRIEIIKLLSECEFVCIKSAHYNEKGVLISCNETSGYDIYCSNSLHNIRHNNYLYFSSTFNREKSKCQELINYLEAICDSLP